MNYKIKAVYRGEVVNTSREATDESSLRKELRNTGYKVISIQKESIFNKDLGSKKLNLKYMFYFCETLASCLKSGLGVTEVLGILKGNCKKKKDKQMFNQILTELEKGNNFSDALAKTKMFDDTFVGIVEIGEQGGCIVETMQECARMYEAKIDIKDKLVQIMIYPCVLLVVFIFMMIFMSVSVIPSMLDMLEGADLPAFTRMYMTVFGVIQHHSVLLGLCIVGIVVGIKSLCKLPGIGYMVDEFKINRSPFKKFRRTIMEVNFFMYLNVMVRAKIPMAQVLGRVKHVFKNRFIKKKLDKTIEELSKGENLAESLRHLDFISYENLSIIATSEKTNITEKVLGIIYSRSSKQLSSSVKKLSAVIEPVMILLVGLFLGSVLLAFAVPLFNMTANMKG